MMRAERALKRASRNRRGVVLFAALALLALLGLLLAGAVTTMTLAGRSSRLAESNVRLAAAAELAATSVVANPTPFALPDLPFGHARTFDIDVPGRGDVRAAVTIARLRDGLLWIVGEAWPAAAEDRGKRRVNLVARLPLLSPIPGAPLVARGPVVVGGAVAFDADTSDAECASASTAPRIAHVADSASFMLSNSQRVFVDSSPAVRHARRDTIVGPGSFSGILIVDGSLAIVGPFTATGLIAARGPISSPRGLTLVGALMSYDSSAHPAIALDSGSVRYSPCAAARELRRLLPPRLVRTRAWLEVF